MLKILIVLLIIGCFIFSFYQRDGAELSPTVARPQVVDDSVFTSLKKVLPPVLFEKDIKPFLEKNRQGGLNAEQLNALMEKLDAIAEALGGKTESAVLEILKKTPGFYPRKSKLERAVDIAGSFAEEAADGLRTRLPALKRMAQDVFHGMVMWISRFLGIVANVFSE